MAGGTPEGLAASGQYAAECQGAEETENQHREGSTVRGRRVGQADGPGTGLGAHDATGGSAAQAERPRRRGEELARPCFGSVKAARSPAGGIDSPGPVTSLSR